MSVYRSVIITGIVLILLYFAKPVFTSDQVHPQTIHFVLAALVPAAVVLLIGTEKGSLIASVLAGFVMGVGVAYLMLMMNFHEPLVSGTIVIAPGFFAGIANTYTLREVRY